ncbi:MAG: SusC/RagA family TonB-linked outer membrane protein [Bacteroidales bacterium]|jgi:TonB-linked SusC/RagA family outer membrane protein
MKKEKTVVYGLKNCRKTTLITILNVVVLLLLNSIGAFSPNIYGENINLEIAQPQQRNITGKVLDVEGVPLPGVYVIVQGTSIGTVTDIDGEFSLDIPLSAEILQFSFIGMKTVEQIIGSESNFSIIMEEDAFSFDEVVVIGYGSVRKKDLTGSVGSIDGIKISERKVTQVSSALQGAIPGLMVTRDNGAPGATSSIRVRGVTTIGDSNPLILVDGMQVSDINQINPADIENISVLKDAASSSIYGSRAASGVILVTTKRAKTGEVAIEYNYEYGIEKPTEFPEYAGPELYMTRINEMQWNTNKNIGAEDPLYSEELIDNYQQLNAENPDEYPMTDWIKLALKKYAPRQTHGLRISAGSKMIKSLTSLSYDEVGGLFEHRNYERFTARFNNDISISDNLSASLDFHAKRDISESPSIDPISWMHITAPIYAAVWSNGLVASGKSSDNFYGSMIYGGFDNTWTNQYGGRVSISYSPLQGLNFKVSVAPEVNNDKRKYFRKQVKYTNYDDPSTYLGTLNANPNTRLVEERFDNHHITSNVIVDYTKSIQNHNLNAMIGYENYYFFSESVRGESEQLELSSFPYLDLANKNFLGVGGNAFENAYRSYFGRLMYNFKDKYLLQGNIRYDGSSRFAKAYRWGAFPSFSAGWVISEEPFMDNIPALSFLKFRISYGKLGNERIGNYPYQSLIQFSNALFQEGDAITSVQTAAQQSYVIEDISWESTGVFDVGLDASFFDNKLQFTGDYYKKVTSDMLLELEIPDFIGYDNPFQNTGKMYTTGWEVELKYRDNIGKLNYSITGNISDSKSIMGDLGGIEFLGDQVKFEGSEFNEWYGYKSDGLHQNKESVENSPLLIANTGPGDIKYVDISGPDGVPDGIISSAYDRVLLGGSLPRYLYGGNISLEYGAFDFSLTFQGVGKQNVKLEDRMVKPFQTGWGNFPMLLEGKYWSTYNNEQQNQSAKYPRLFYDSANNYVMSDFWLFNGSYFRMKNMSLGYTVPNKLTERYKVKNLRIYASISDFMSINNYPKGWDPELSRNGYPITASYIIGVSVKF